MANAPIGNDFLEGQLGVVTLEFNGVDLGKTTDDTMLKWIEDIKDISYQQNGTQPYDKIPTGQAWEVTCKIGEITGTKLQSLWRGITVASGGSTKYGRDIYRSGRDNFAKELIIRRVDSDGVASTDAMFKAVFYKAMPTTSGEIPYGADTQRDVELVFYCFFDETKLAFGYHGYASSLGL